MGSLVLISTFLSAQGMNFYKINDNQVRIRQTPSTKGTILTVAGVDNCVLVVAMGTEKEVISGVEGTWASVYFNGFEGYVFSPFVGQKVDGISVIRNGFYYDIRVDALKRTLAKVTFRISYDPLHRQLLYIADTNFDTHDLGNLKAMSLDSGKESILGKSLSYRIPSDYSQVVYDVGEDRPWLTMNLISKSLLDLHQLFQIDLTKELRQKQQEADATYSWRFLNDSTLSISISGQLHKRYECTLLLPEKKLQVSYLGEEK